MRYPLISHPLAVALIGGALLSAPGSAAACCPSGGNTGPTSAKGLGEAFPPTADLAADPAWSVYEFERAGIRYLQVNDGTGKVRAAVGRIGEILWVLPVGTDADRVTVPGEPAPTTTGTGTVIYRGPDLEVRRTQGAAGDTWSIVPADGQ